MLSMRPQGVPLGIWRRCLWISLSILSSDLIHGTNAEFSYEAITAVLARITISYINPISKEPRSITADIGRFAEGTIGSAAGVLINPRLTNVSSSSSAHFLQGCNPNWAAPAPAEPWLALLLRGGCSDAEKVKIAIAQNASAVLLFGGDNETYLQKENKFKGTAIVVYVLRQKGEQLSFLLTNGTKVLIAIARGQEVKFRITSINRTSVLFVSVSFIVLMVVSLAWLIFYYIQRFRYINAKDKLARHLCTVAKKALAKVPVKSVKNNDKEIEDSECCAVCIEQYQVSDSVRTLPCKHQFHKTCVDPWLLEHRTCPMCKMDILKYYGYVSNTENSEPRNTIREVSNVELGRGQRREPSNSRLSNGHGTPQVSLISQSEISTRTEIVERSSSNPAGDGALPQFRQPSSGFGASTTAAIRSMINSARPRVVPVHLHTAVTNIEESSKIKDVGGTTGDSSSDIDEREAVESLDNLSTLTEISNASEDQSHEEDEKTLNSIGSSIATSGPTSQDASGSDIECDIEYLVKEIMDIDTDSEQSSKSISQFNSSNCSPKMDESSSSKNVIERDLIKSVEKNPQSDHRPVGPLNSSSELPLIECDSQTVISLSLEDIPRSRRQSTTFSNSSKKSSLQDQDSLAITSEDNLSTHSADKQRPSSHLITITHS